VTLHVPREETSYVSSRELRVGVFAIVKNEAPYIEEWIAYHRACGCTHVFIADNGSCDGCRELLERLQKQGLCRVIDFATPPDRPPQLPAYVELAQRFGQKVDWMAFVDADEFIVTDEAFATIPDFLTLFHAQPQVGAIALNWACYGSSGREAHEDEFVVKRFQHRAEQHALINHHYKSIVRSAAFAGPGRNPHHFQLKTGYSYAAADGQPLALSPQRGAGLSRSVVWTNARINHYVVKSRQEFFERKAPRGRAATPGQTLGESFFRGHDRNEVHDPFPDRLLHRLDRVHSRLKSPAHQPARELASEAAGTAGVQAGFGEDPQQNFYRAIVDKVERLGTDLQIKGWAIAPENGPVEDIQLRSGNVPIRCEIVGMARNDVLRVHPGAFGDVGFQIRTSLLEPDLDTSRPLEIWSEHTRLSRVPVAEELQWSPGTDELLKEPLMPTAYLDQLTAALAKAQALIDFGSGASTVLAADNPDRSVISVSNDWKILRSVRLLISDKGALDRTHLKFIETGPIGKNGFPKDNAIVSQWHQYALAPWMYCREQHLAPDLVLVGGRFRRACALASLLFASPQTRILFHDYFDRPYYQSVEKHLVPNNRTGQMAEFIRPATIDATALWIELMEAVCDPR